MIVNWNDSGGWNVLLLGESVSLLCGVSEGEQVERTLSHSGLSPRCSSGSSLAEGKCLSSQRVEVSP